MQTHIYQILFDCVNSSIKNGKYNFLSGPGKRKIVYLCDVLKILEITRFFLVQYSQKKGCPICYCFTYYNQIYTNIYISSNFRRQISNDNDDIQFNLFQVQKT